MEVWFFTKDNTDVGGVQFYFTSPPQYSLVHCTTSLTDFPVDLPSGTTKDWTIVLTRTSGIELKVYCNDVEVLDVVISDSICGTGVYTRWNGDVDKIMFHRDKASDYYRPGKFFRRKQINKEKTNKLILYQFYMIKS